MRPPKWCFAWSVSPTGPVGGTTAVLLRSRMRVKGPKKVAGELPVDDETHLSRAAAQRGHEEHRGRRDEQPRYREEGREAVERRRRLHERQHGGRREGAEGER